MDLANSRLPRVFAALWSLVLLCAAIGTPRIAFAQQGSTFLPLIKTPTVSASTVILPESGGTILAPGGLVRVTFFAGAVSEPTTVTLRFVSPPPPPGFESTGMTVEISLRSASGAELHHVNVPARLRFDPHAISEAVIMPHTLAVYHESAGVWTPAGSKIDLDGWYESQVSNFSAYGLFGRSTRAGMVGIEAAPDGSVYWINNETGLIYRQGPGHTPEIVANFATDGLNTLFDGQRADALARAADGTFYISDVHNLRRVLPNGTSERLFSLPAQSTEPLGGVAVDARNGALFVGGSRFDFATHTLAAAPGGVTGRSVVVDSQGRLFTLALNFARSYGQVTPTVQEWWDLYVAWIDNPARPAELVASGLVGARGLAACGDVIFAGNEAADVISVIDGKSLLVTGRIATPAPWAVACSSGALWAGSHAQGTLAFIPAMRRDGPVASAPIVQAPANLAGTAAAVSVQLSALDPVPAHHTLRIGGIAVSDLAIVDTNARRLTYHLPSPFVPPPAGTALAPSLAAWGAYQFAIAGGGGAKAAATTLPEPTNWLPWRSNMTIAAGEWLVWSPAGEYRPLRFESVEGLFPAWTPERGHWLAWQFNTVGVFHFREQREGAGIVEWIVNVQTEAAEDRFFHLPISPQLGADIFMAGMHVTIPPGALPDTSHSYTLTVGVFPSEGPTLPSGRVSNRYSVGVDPEPALLNASIHIAMPYVARQGDDPVAAVCGSNADECEPILFHYAAGQIVVELPAGPYHEVLYPGKEEWQSANATSAEGISSTPIAPTGERPRAPFHTFSGHIFWLVGLADEQWESEHFIVRYNSGVVGAQYSHDVILDLETAWQVFKQRGLPMPNDKVIVRLLSWIPQGMDGFAPKVGTLGHWYMAMNSALNEETRKATAAHEFFHIVQKESLSLEGRIVVPDWFMEASATWAEAVAFPDVTQWKTTIGVGCRFANRGLPQWDAFPALGGLSVDEQYAAAAFILYLEQQSPGAVADILGQLNGTNLILAALSNVVGNLGDFYREFAKAYWSQSMPYAAEWSMGGCQVWGELTVPASLMEWTTVPPLSSGLVRRYYAPQPGVPQPAGFSEASGTALRVAQPAATVEFHVLTGGLPPLKFGGQGLSPLPHATANEGGKLDTTVSEHMFTHSIWILYINTDQAAGAGPTSVAVDAPTLVDCPSVFDWTPGTTVVSHLAGGGLGPVQGTVSLPGAAVMGWGEQGIDVQWTPPGAGAYPVRATHALGITSNSCTVSVYQD